MGRWWWCVCLARRPALQVLRSGEGESARGGGDTAYMSRCLGGIASPPHTCTCTRAHARTHTFVCGAFVWRPRSGSSLTPHTERERPRHLLSPTSACSSAAIKEHLSHLRTGHTHVTETDPLTLRPPPTPLPSRPPPLCLLPPLRPPLVCAPRPHSPMYQPHTHTHPTFTRIRPSECRG